MEVCLLSMLIKLWLSIVLIVVALGIGFFLSYLHSNNSAEGVLKKAREEEKQIINDAIKSAESKKREALVEAKEEIHRNRAEYEREE